MAVLITPALIKATLVRAVQLGLPAWRAVRGRVPGNHSPVLGNSAAVNSQRGELF